MPRELSQLEKMELKADLNEQQKEYLEKLKAELEKIAGGRSAQEILTQGI